MSSGMLERVVRRDAILCLEHGILTKKVRYFGVEMPAGLYFMVSEAGIVGRVVKKTVSRQ